MEQKTTLELISTLTETFGRFVKSQKELDEIVVRKIMDIQKRLDLLEKCSNASEDYPLGGMAEPYDIRGDR